jgi:hypothetical protein
VTTFVADLFHGDGATASMTDSFNPGAANYLRIWVIAEGGVSLSSISFGAQTPTFITGSDNGDILGCWELVSPSNSLQTITVNLSGSSGRCAFYAISRSGVNTGTPSGTPGLGSGSSTSASATASSAAGQLVEGIVHVAEATVSSDVGQTERENQPDWVSVFRSFSAAEKAGAASVTLSWTPPSSTDWFAVAIPILPAAGAASPKTLMLLGVG